MLILTYPIITPTPPLHSLSGKMLIWAMRNIERRLQQIEILSDGTPANESDLLDLVKDWCTGITRYDTVYPSLYRLVWFHVSYLVLSVTRSLSLSLSFSLSLSLSLSLSRSLSCSIGSSIYGFSITYEISNKAGIRSGFYATVRQLEKPANEEAPYKYKAAYSSNPAPVPLGTGIKTLLTGFESIIK